MNLNPKRDERERKIFGSAKIKREENNFVFKTVISHKENHSLMFLVNCNPSYAIYFPQENVDGFKS
jgi:hypothetical protein